MLTVVQNGKNWATKPTISAGVLMYVGHKCEDCYNFHKRDLAFWPWCEACSLFRHSTGATRTQMEHAQRNRPIQYKPEHVFQKQSSGMLRIRSSHLTSTEQSSPPEHTLVISTSICCRLRTCMLTCRHAFTMSTRIELCGLSNVVQRLNCG